MRFLLILVTLVSVMLSPSLAAQPLTDTQINRFIASFEALAEIESVHEAFEEMGDEQAGSEAIFFSDVLDSFKQHPSYADFKRVIRRHGFRSGEEWASLSDRIIKAMITHEINASRPQIEAEMEEMLRELRNNEHLSAEMKEQFERQARSQLSQMNEMWSAPEGDVRAIQPHIATLRKVLEFGDDDY